jgi:hypothetical protein
MAAIEWRIMLASDNGARWRLHGGSAADSGCSEPSERGLRFTVPKRSQ